MTGKKNFTPHKHQYILENDEALNKWFTMHPDVQTTVMKCERCGLFYKPSLGHKCKVRRDKDER